MVWRAVRESSTPDQTGTRCAGPGALKACTCALLVSQGSAAGNDDELFLQLQDQWSSGSLGERPCWYDAADSGAADQHLKTTPLRARLRRALARWQLEKLEPLQNPALPSNWLKVHCETQRAWFSSPAPLLLPHVLEVCV